MARLKFDNYFTSNILRLLNYHPADLKTNDGEPFWIGFKKLPSALNYDNLDPTHKNFIHVYSVLLADALKIPF